MENKNPSFGYENVDVRSWREGFVLTMLRVASLLGIVLIVVSFPTTVGSDRFIFIGLYLILLAVTLLRVPYMVRAYTLLLAIFIVGINAVIDWGPWADGSVFLLTTIVLATIMLDRGLDIIVLAISTLAAIAIAVMQQIGVYQISANAPSITPTDWAIYIVDFTVAGGIIVAAVTQFKTTFMRSGRRMQDAFDAVESARKSLDEQVQEHAQELDSRLTQIRTASQAIHSIAGIQNIAELLDTSTRLIAERFGYYHVGLLILDDQRKLAYLQASSSAAGAQLIGQAIRLAFDKRDPLVVVIEQNRAAIMSDIDMKNFVPDPNFPLTRSRMILPLAIHNEVIGMLDIHSEQPQAFDAQDAEILQTIADLTAISFDNVRLVNETKSLINQLEINTAIQTKRTWSKLTSRHKPAYQYTPAGVRPIFSPDKRVESGDLLVPLVLSGQRIGAIKLKRKGNAAAWSERERGLVEKIADQVALALENSRLVDEAQKSAMRDQMIANISTQIRETLDIEAVIRTAATELRRVFDLKEAEIVIGTQQTDSQRITASLGKGR